MWVHIQDVRSLNILVVCVQRCESEVFRGLYLGFELSELFGGMCCKN